ncbi:GntR family transcriptional regulator [Sinorhizobium numidicum]|uniref:GntR family transcriptional regulator n=1 Tax=Sinorhizobium numidicum TaxID=680248 RepID=A0ABY8CND2_9HYPH|nr:GntR family transcriptional regulator [Sinorhizobium numidicum]WEX74189.1 GntR family transcriptional regulator [Sinorhizobium numidicum]WEX80174.1 GntR family transcriptional regulator [Sinorhizobium numidicum]
MSQRQRRAVSSPSLRSSGGVKLRRVTTSSAIYDQLHAAIVSLQMKPGMALQEKRISEEFGVSRTPVREALLRLAEAGLVEIFPQSGTFVSRIPVAAIPEAVVIRKSLEGTTVKHAAEVASAGDIARLDAIIARQRVHAGLNETSLFHEQDEAFHESISAIAGYPGVWTILRTVKLQIDRARRLTLPVLGRMNSVIEEHMTIRDAIAAHDRERAHAAMMHHLSAVIPDIDELRLLYPGYFS